MSYSFNVRGVRQKGSRQSIDQSDGQRKTPASFVHQLPYTSLPKHVLWLSLPQQQDYGSVSLSVELEYFAEYVKLDEKEEWCRSHLLEDLNGIIKEEFPHAQVNAFGSFPVGLSTYASDLDVTVMFCGPNTITTKDSYLDIQASNSSLAFTTELNSILEPPESSLLEKRTHPELEPAPDKRLKTSHRPTTHTTTLENGMDNSSNVESERNIESGSLSSYDREEARVQNIFNLQAVHATLQELQWVARIDLRHRARVPIVNFLHSSGVECDISADLPHHSTVAAVNTLIHNSGPALYVLSAFLKIYLNQLGLDAPYTGGLGSYKLYILLARHIELNPKLITLDNVDYGTLLVSFLKYYGTKKHLNANTVVQVGSAEAATFERTSKIIEIQRAFEAAYSVLVKCAVRAANPSASSKKYVGREVASCAMLAGLLNTEVLCRERMRRRALCHQYYNTHIALVTHTSSTTYTNNNTNAQQEVNDCMYGNHVYFDDSNGSHSSNSSANNTSTPSATTTNNTNNTTSGTLSTSVSSDELQLLALKSRLLQKRLSSRRLALEGTAGSAGADVDSGVDNSVVGGGSDELAVSNINTTASSSIDNTSPPTISTINPTTTTNINTNTHTLTDPRLLLNPHDLTGKSIISSQFPLPMNMIVRDEHKMFLPNDTQRRLGPFRNLQIGEKYTSKSVDELVGMQSEQKKRVEVLMEQVYGVGSGGSGNGSAGGSGNSYTNYGTTTNTSTTDTATKVRIPLIFSPLNPYCKLITEGVIPLPHTMKISLKQQLLIEEAGHVREGVDVLVRQRQRCNSVGSDGSGGSGGSSGSNSGGGRTGSTGSSGTGYNSNTTQQLSTPLQFSLPSQLIHRASTNTSEVVQDVVHYTNTVHSERNDVDDVCSIESYSDWEELHYSDTDEVVVKESCSKDEGTDKCAYTDATCTNLSNNRDTNTTNTTNTTGIAHTSAPPPLSRNSSASDVSIGCAVDWTIDRKPISTTTLVSANDTTITNSSVTNTTQCTTGGRLSTSTSDSEQSQPPTTLKQHTTTQLISPDNSVYALPSTTLPPTLPLPPPLPLPTTLFKEVPAQLRSLVPLSWGKVQLIRENDGRGRVVDIKSEFPADTANITATMRTNDDSSASSVCCVNSGSMKPKAAHRPAPAPHFVQNNTLGHRAHTDTTTTSVDNSSTITTTTGGETHRKSGLPILPPRHSTVSLPNTTSSGAGATNVAKIAPRAVTPLVEQTTTVHDGGNSGSAGAKRSMSGSVDGGTGSGRKSAQALAKPVARKSSVRALTDPVSRVSGKCSGVGSGVSSGEGVHCDRTSAAEVPQHPPLPHYTTQYSDQFARNNAQNDPTHNTQQYLPQLQFLTQAEHSTQFSTTSGTTQPYKPYSDTAVTYQSSNKLSLHDIYDTANANNICNDGGMYHTTSAPPPPPNQPQLPPPNYYDVHNNTGPHYNNNSNDVSDANYSFNTQYIPAPLPPPPLHVPPPPTTPYFQPTEPFLPPPPVQDYYGDASNYNAAHSTAYNTSYVPAHYASTDHNYPIYTPQYEMSSPDQHHATQYATQYSHSHSDSQLYPIYPNGHYAPAAGAQYNNSNHSATYTGFDSAQMGVSGLQAPPPLSGQGQVQDPGQSQAWQPNAWY